MHTTSPIQTLNINLYSGPGVGKSVLAARLFVALKMKGINAGQVSEYAKELVYLNIVHETPQKTIVLEQLRRQAMLQGKVAVVITDAPVPLSLVYSKGALHEELKALVREQTEGWRSLDVLLSRNVTNSYETAGRYQSAAEAQQFHEKEVAPFVRDYCAGQGLLELPVSRALPALQSRIFRELDAFNLTAAGA